MLTDQDVYHYINCPHWPYWERFGDAALRRPLPLDEEARLADRLGEERALVQRLFPAFQEVVATDLQEACEHTLQLMQAGVEVIYRGCLQNDGWSSRPDLLLRAEGKSVFGDYYYVPWNLRRGHELKKEYKAELMTHVSLLEIIQRRFPREPGTITADGERFSFDAAEMVGEWQEIKAALERIEGGERPDPVYRKSCEDTSPWGRACFQLAAEGNDIALLFNVDVRKLQALRSLGIRTVDEAAEMDPVQYEGQIPGLTLRALQAVQRQARSLREMSVIIREPFTHETAGAEIHFDIESYPPLDIDYLYGFWMFQDGVGSYRSFVAEKPEDEEKLWKDFLAWLPTLPSTYTVYHYANYEATRLMVLAARYGDTENPWLERFIDSMFDLKEAARDHAVFPLYFYSLKKICQFLGFDWSGEVKNGGDSISVFRRWLQTGDRAILESLLQYNQDDVEATVFLLNWLKRYAQQETVYSSPYPWSKKSC